MKLKKLLSLSVFGLVFILFAVFNKQVDTSIRSNHHIEVRPKKIVEKKLTLEESVELQEYNSRFNNNLKYIHPKFHHFNKSIDSNITKKFVEVMIHYNLDESKYKRKMYTGQILLESGAKQYDSYGDIITSYAGAVGLTQIMPATCLDIFKRVIKSKDSLELIKLGASDFTFAHDRSLTKDEQLSLATEWLSNVNNNIILWGFIMSRNLKNTGDIHKQLVAYNVGLGGMNRYISNGGDCSNHIYIRGINSKLSVSSR